MCITRQTIWKQRDFYEVWVVAIFPVLLSVSVVVHRRILVFMAA